MDTAVTLLETAFVVALCFATFMAGISRTKFHGDESQWIATSHYFESFVQGDFGSDVWGTSYWTLTQPPVTRYVIGFGRRLGGFRVTDLNRPWDYGASDAVNRATGRIPSPGLLWWSRAPMMVLATISGLLLFSIVRDCAGRVGAYVFLALFLTNGLVVQSLCRAMGEAPLLASLAAASWWAVCALRSWTGVAAVPNPRRVRLWFALVGTQLGIAGAAKLNALPALASAAALAIVAAWANQAQRPRREVRHLLWTSLIVCVAGLITFVALNPFLYRAPWRTVTMVQHRLHEMRTQEGERPQSHIRGIGPRIEALWARLFRDDSAMAFTGAPVLYFASALLGLGVLLRRASAWLRSRDQPAGPVVVLVFAVTTVGPALFTPLDWSRYYLLPVVFVILCSATGVAAAVDFLRLRFASPRPAAVRERSRVRRRRSSRRRR